MKPYRISEEIMKVILNQVEDKEKIKKLMEIPLRDLERNVTREIVEGEFDYRRRKYELTRERAVELGADVGDYDKHFALLLYLRENVGILN